MLTGEGVAEMGPLRNNIQAAAWHLAMRAPGEGRSGGKLF